MDETLPWAAAPGEAVLRMPDQRPVGGLVALHGASDGAARQPLFDGLGRALTPAGIALLSFPRRSVAHGDTPLSVQADDALAAVRLLRARTGGPVGLFGFSQGAWAACEAAARPAADTRDAVDVLVVLGHCGVTPAEQMRFYTDELLRRHGFGDHDRRENRRVRLLLEDHLRRPVRDQAARDDLATVLAEAARHAWFEHAYLPTEPPGTEDRWDDMDADPRASMTRLRCPVLALWGDDEECVPREESRARWLESGADVTLVDLPGCGHWPASGSGAPGYAGQEVDPLAPAFTSTTTDWLLARWD